MKNKTLTINNLSKNYYTDTDEIEAIKDFSFSFDDGEIIAIVGPSGCGKSTLLSIIGGLEEKTNGNIIFNKDIKIGYMLQQDALFPWKNILDNCLLGLEIKKELTKDKEKEVINLLTTYGLKEFIYKYPNELSGGMRQRVLRMLYTHKRLLKSCL